METNNTVHDNYHLDSVKDSFDTRPEDTPNVESWNIDISLADEQQAVAWVKLVRKVPAIGIVSVQAFTNPTCINLLHKLVNYSFESGKLYSLWKLRVVNPIPKCSSKEPRVSLSYRGITRISVPCNIYCDILNKHLMVWPELNKVLVNEHNRYRNRRCYEDHLYSPHNIIKGR